MAQLDTKRIAAAAIAALDARGIPGFTIRAVADRLGVTPMALYNHVPDKAGLAALVVNTAMEEYPLASPTGSWREDLIAVAHWMRQTTFAHPAVAELQQMYKVWTPAMLHFAERWLGVWQQSGLSHEQAVFAAAASSWAISGVVVGGLARGKFVRPDDSMLALMPNARLLFSYKPDPQEMFELSVRAIIDGLYTILLHREMKAPRVASAAPAKRNVRRISRARL